MVSFLIVFWHLKLLWDICFPIQVLATILRQLNHLVVMQKGSELSDCVYYYRTMSYMCNLCKVVCEEHFGPIVAKVAECLLKESAPFGMIVQRFKGQLTAQQIRRSIAILEQHNIVTFELVNAQRIVYKGNVEYILALVRAPRFSLLAKRLFGTVAEVVIEEILREGRLTCSETLRKVADRLKDQGTGLGEIKEKFVRLAESQFIVRLPTVEHVIKGCPIFQTQYDMFIMPDLVLEDVKANGESATTVEGSRKRKAVNADRDDGIYWRVNVKRFDRFIRDELVCDLISGPKTSGVTAASDVVCRQTVSALLRVNEVRATAPGATESFPISVFDVMRSVKDNELNLEKKDVEWALKVLCDESNGILRKAGDSSGGLYVVDFGRAIRIRSQTHIESMIREQLEGRAVRIFRLLEKSGFLEEEQIEKLVMMSPKQTRELLYAMLEENYISVRPMGKTNDFAPARTYYLYHMDFQRCVRMVEENTCKILRNLILRRTSDTREQKVLLERNLKMESIIKNIEEDESVDEETKKQQIDEVREVYLNAGDQSQLDQYRKSQEKLLASELEIENALFVFRMHLLYSDRAPPPKIGRGRKSIA